MFTTTPRSLSIEPLKTITCSLGSAAAAVAVGATLYARNRMNRGDMDDEFERFGSERTKIRHEVRLWNTHP